MEEEGYVSPARKESRLVMVQLEPKLQRKEKKYQLGKARWEEKSQILNTDDFSSLRKHVAVRKSLMATYAHDVRLNVRRKILNVL